MSKIHNKPLKIINNNSNFFNKNSHSNTALKLINNYADSYSKLELENKSLLNQIKDLKINLKISKEIIDSFLSNKTTKINDIIIALNKEINHLNKIIENSNKEKEDFEKNYLILISANSVLKNENLLIKNKLFNLEQKIIKKENLLKIYEKKFNNNFIVISPNKANIKLNNELLFYKNLYKKISRLLKKNVEKMDKYENVINDLEYQNENLENLNKIEKNNNKKEKENLIFKIRKTIIDNNISINNISHNNNNNSNISNNKNEKSYRSNNINLNNNNNYHLNLINNNKSEIKNKLEFSDEKINKSLDNIDLFSKFQKDIDINNSEFNDILKQCGINKNSYNLMSRNKNLSKVVEAFEFLNKLIHDKNFTIKILEHENKELFEKNFQLNQENINLINKINNNNSNNNNNITINNLNINNLLNYNNNNNKSLEENIMTFESNISSSEFEIKNSKNYASFVLTSSNTDE